jgi:ferredoxin
MAIKKVWIEEGCTSCGICESICPDVFEIPDEARVIEGADFEAFEEEIKEAADNCPVEVIKYSE